MIRRLSLACLLLSFSALQAGSSNSLLDVSPDGKLLLAVNADNGSVTVIDTVQKAALREIKVGDKPEGVTWIGNGPLAVVTLYHENHIALLDTQAGKVVKRLKVAAEPYGIVSDSTGKKAYVSHEYPGIVSEIDLEAFKVVREIPAGNMIRGIALTPDGKRLYVTEFYTAALNAIDLAQGKIVDSWVGHSTDNLARNVVLHPKREKAYIPHIRSMVKVNDGSGSIFPHLSFVDLKPGKEKRRTSFAMDTFNGVYVTTNPWEAAISPDGKKFVVVYAGTNDGNFLDVVDDDYKEVASNNQPRQLGNNPRAVRFSPDSTTVYVYNAMDFAVQVIAGKGTSTTIKTCEPAKTPDWVRGKIVFNTALPPLTTRRWIACSSCHPDGHADGRVWQQGEGLRKTTAFMGMAHTHPLHYSADRDEVQDFEFTIRSKLMQGRGLIKGSLPTKVGFHKIELEEKTSGRSKDLDAMAIYCNSFDTPLSPHILAPGKLSPEAERGKALFFRDDLACAKCHSGPYFTDSRLEKPYRLHDVGTGADDPSERMGPTYDTPTLVGIYRTSPYLHHGKAKTLEEVLTVFNAKDKHGKTSHLKKNEIDELVAFMKALPYEPLPEVTPNAVTYRIPPRATKE